MLCLSPCLTALAALFSVASAQSDEASISLGVDRVAEVLEESDPGTPVAIVTINGLAQNSLVSCFLDNERFQLWQGQNGNERLLVTAASFDRETEAQHDVSVCCMVSGARPTSECTTITVNILDINDNTPTFPDTFRTLMAAENTDYGSTIAHVQAYDPDVGENARVTYEKQPSSNLPIIVDKDTGAIKVSSALDRELASSYTFVIVASDHGVPSRSGSILVNVHVQDMNDNAPAFDKSEYEMTVTCGVPVGYQIGSFGVTDQDAGENGQVSLALSQDSEVPTSLFSLNSTTLLTSVPLTSDLVGQYSFHVVASDHGSPSLSATVPVTVNVTCNTF